MEGRRVVVLDVSCESVRSIVSASTVSAHTESVPFLPIFLAEGLRATAVGFPRLARREYRIIAILSRQNTHKRGDYAYTHTYRYIYIY